MPADYACFPIYDCILSRLSNDDAPDQGLSHFGSEMRSMSLVLSVRLLVQYGLDLLQDLRPDILQSLGLFQTPLVIVDELVSSL